MIYFPQQSHTYFNKATSFGITIANYIQTATHGLPLTYHDSLNDKDIFSQDFGTAFHWQVEVPAQGLPSNLKAPNQI